jgi:hypothetical protein
MFSLLRLLEAADGGSASPSKTEWRTRAADPFSVSPPAVAGLVAARRVRHSGSSELRAGPRTFDEGSPRRPSSADSPRLPLTVSGLVYPESHQERVTFL